MKNYIKRLFTRDANIKHLHIEIQNLKEYHRKELQNLKKKHQEELESKNREISQLNIILEKAYKWFPLLKEMLRIEKLCSIIGFTKDMIDRLLLKNEAIRCSGKIYSEEYKRKFEIKGEVFKIEKDPANDKKLMLTINRLSLVDWFKEQFKKIQQVSNDSVTIQKSKGFRL